MITLDMQTLLPTIQRYKDIIVREKSDEEMMQIRIDEVTRYMLQVMDFDQYILILERAVNVNHLIAMCLWERPEMATRLRGLVVGWKIMSLVS